MQSVRGWITLIQPLRAERQTREALLKLVAFDLRRSRARKVMLLHEGRIQYGKT